MTKEELEKEVRALRIEVERLRHEQNGDIIRFQELEIIKIKYEEAAMYLMVITNIGKWTSRITAGFIAVILWIKRSAIWGWLNQVLT